MTARRIYYIRKPGCPEWNEPPVIGFIDRQDFEADTRCRETCLRDIPAGLVCGPHGRSFGHCVHWGVPWKDQDPRCIRGGGCGEPCSADALGAKCAAHGYTWDHCPHGRGVGDCWHGHPAGCADLPRGQYGGGTIYATREAAEEELYRWERERERKRAEAGPELKRLRVAMMKAHPDAGGSHEAFLEARAAYERAVRQAS